MIQNYLTKLKSRGSTKLISIPKKSEKLAEFIGIMLGDGNLHFYKRGRKIGSYMVRISGNAIKDEFYLKNYVYNLCKKLFSIEPKFYKQPNSNCLHLIIHSRMLVEFLIDIGLKPGNKIVSQVSIPDWIWKDKRFLRACIRGLIDTDGCVYELKPHWPGLFQIIFENRNVRLLKDYRKALEILGFSPSKICGNRTEFGTKVYLTRKDEIQRYYKEIGTSNPRIEKQISPLIRSK